MIDEKGVRQPTFVEGTRIRLANGQTWSFPDQLPCEEEDEHQGLLRAIGEAEDEPERLRGELALAIYLLSLNYHLTSSDYTLLLSFDSRDPALAEMQTALGELATRQRRALRPGAAVLAGGHFSPPLLWRLSHLLRRPKHV
jgi:hypothetical protein